MADRIVVVGMPFHAVAPPADLYVGGRRHLADAGVSGLEIGAGGVTLDGALDRIAETAGTVCVLASGDPGFFGVTRALADRFGPESLVVHPGPSSVSLAFARLGLPWDDAVVVSAHGRPLTDAVLAGGLTTASKCAVLVGPDAPPEALAKELLAVRARPAEVMVCSRLGLVDESVTRTDLDGLAAGTWDPLSVVVLLRGRGVADRPALVWGQPESRFRHRRGMVTKAEVRAIVLSKLELPSNGVLWDVGAGSGSVGIEASLLAGPGLRVLAVERRADDVGRIEANVAGAGAVVEVVHGDAPAALADLPDPDRVFVGGGGLDVLRASVARLRSGGVAVATFAALDRAAAAAELLGDMVQVVANRGERLPDGGWRLVGDNPVFVVWGEGGPS